MRINQLRRHLDIIGSQAKRHEVVGKCNIGDTIFINDRKAICKHKTSTGSYRFKIIEEPQEVITYDRSEMKISKKAYDVMKQIDELLEREYYS